MPSKWYASPAIIAAIIGAITAISVPLINIMIQSQKNKGILIISTEPTKAKIRVFKDSKEFDYKVGMELRSGAYRIEISAENYITIKDKMIIIKPNEPFEQSIKLERETEQNFSRINEQAKETNTVIDTDSGKIQKLYKELEIWAKKPVN